MVVVLRERPAPFFYGVLKHDFSQVAVTDQETEVFLSV